MRLTLERVGSGPLRVGQTVKLTATVFNDGPGKLTRARVRPNIVRGFTEIRMSVGGQPCSTIGCDITTPIDGVRGVQVTITAVYRDSRNPSFNAVVSTDRTDPNPANGMAWLAFTPPGCKSTLTVRASTLLGAATARKVRSAEVWVEGRRVKRLTRPAVRRAFTVTGLTGSQANVKIVARTRAGRKLTRTRIMSLCG